MLESTGSPRPRLALAVRTRFFDDLVTSAVTRGVRAVVMLASGLDTRPYRLPLGGVEWFEIDRGPVHAHKAEVLRMKGAVPNAARVVSIDADVTGDFFPALVGAGFDTKEPALFIAEGLLMYLADESARSLLARIALRAAPASEVAFDLPNAIEREGNMARHHRDLEAAGAGWRFSCAEPQELFPEAWDVDVRHLGHPHVHFGRWPTPPTDTPGSSSTLLVVARRR